MAYCFYTWYLVNFTHENEITDGKRGDDKDGCERSY